MRGCSCTEKLPQVKACAAPEAAAPGACHTTLKLLVLKTSYQIQYYKEEEYIHIYIYVSYFCPQLCVGLLFLRSVPPAYSPASSASSASSSLSHTSLSHTIFHTHLCHTPSFTHHLSHTSLSHTIFHGRRGTWRHRPAFCMAGVALGDIDLRFAWQAWHLANLATSTFVLRGRRALMTLGWIWWRAWVRLVARDAAALLRGRGGAWHHGPAFCVAGVALLGLC